MANTNKEEENVKQKLINHFVQLRSDALKRGLSEKQVSETLKVPGVASKKSQIRCKVEEAWRKFYKYVSQRERRIHVLVVILAFSIGFIAASYQLVIDYVVTTPCLVENNMITQEIYRPLVNCDMCRDIDQVPEERNISGERFYRLYSFTGRPVLIKEATSNWRALSHFSFKFFQELYNNKTGALQHINDECQFFPYQTDFDNLQDVFNMSDDRASFKEGEQPWYIGWSNCHKGVANVLRRYYKRPYFLPADSEMVLEDWIFMGGSGPGANMHLDTVDRPSWQAQISGRKTWKLVPSAECSSVCKPLSVTVNKGDIIVLDTNIWYHSTFIHPGEISITIGSEFD